MQGGGQLLVKVAPLDHGFITMLKPNVYLGILRKLKATPRINKWLKQLKRPFLASSEAHAHLIFWGLLWRAPAVKGFLNKVMKSLKHRVKKQTTQIIRCII